MNPFPFSPTYVIEMMGVNKNEWERPLNRLKLASILGVTFPLEMMTSEFRNRVDNEEFVNSLNNGQECMSFAGPVDLRDYLAWSDADYSSIIGYDGQGIHIWCVKPSSRTLRELLTKSAITNMFPHIGIPLLVRSDHSSSVMTTVIETICILMAFDVLTTIVSEWLRVLQLDTVLAMQVVVNPCPINYDYIRQLLCVKEKTHLDEVKEVRKYIHDIYLIFNWNTEKNYYHYYYCLY